MLRAVSLPCFLLQLGSFVLLAQSREDREGWMLVLEILWHPFNTFDVYGEKKNLQRNKGNKD